jgi:thioester reductase-like protein
MTKIVSEYLLSKSKSKFQIPIIIFRPGSICGSSESGVFNKEAYIHKLILGIIELKKYPIIIEKNHKERDILFDWNPVNIVASSLVSISLNIHSTTNTIFHLNHPLSIRSGSMKSLINQINNHSNYNIEGIDFEEWKKLLSLNPNCSLFPLYSYFNNDFPKEYFYSTKNTISALETINRNEGSSLIFPNMDNSNLIKLIITFAESQNLIQKL